jgi:hypothetical protein
MTRDRRGIIVLRFCGCVWLLGCEDASMGCTMIMWLFDT